MAALLIRIAPINSFNQLSAPARQIARLVICARL